MYEKVLFFESTFERLKSACAEASEPFSGIFIGFENDRELFVHGHYSFEQSNPKYLVKQLDEAIGLLPIGFRIVGYFFKSPQAHLPNVVRNLCKKIFPNGSTQHKVLASKNSESNVLIGVLDEGNQPDLNLYWFTQGSQVLSPAFKPSQASEEMIRQLTNRYVLCHLHARLPFSFHDTLDPADRKLSLETSMSALALQLGSSVVCFKVMQNSGRTKPLFLRGDDRSKVDKIQSHFKLRASSNELLQSKGDLWRCIDTREFLTVEVMAKMTDLASAGGKAGFLSCVPVLHHDHIRYDLVTMDLPLDLLVILDLGEKNVDNGNSEENTDDDDDDDDSNRDIFFEAIRRQLRAFTDFLFTSKKDSSYSVPRPHHFKVPDTCTIVTCIYPDDADESKLAPLRKELHLRFLVPLTSPTFKRSNCLQFHGKADDPIIHPINVHLGLPASKASGKVSLVKGGYQYRHYMQDGTDDSGWGCAYRSLQTIASWLKLQGFTGTAPPSHLEIQQALVDVGDKPASFINSKQWIGSTEVSYVLDHLYNVQSKISHVSSGSEMMSKVREIAHHFDTQGTPIMIGGGALAHTILGIDFNEETGKVFYLVLDPHYVGPEDIKVIQNKGWCGWKGPEFWKANSFYNMCMPLKPSDF